MVQIFIFVFEIVLLGKLETDSFRMFVQPTVYPTWFTIFIGQSFIPQQLGPENRNKILQKQKELKNKSSFPINFCEVVNDAADSLYGCKVTLLQMFSCKK